MDWLKQGLQVLARILLRLLEALVGALQEES